MHPIKHCYWVEPGKLLAGEYPRNLDDASSLEKIAALLRAGVTAFIDLTEEDEGLKPYAHLLNGTATHQRFAIRDLSIPASAAVTTAILDAIDDHLAHGRLVYVHCWGGVGRTGVIVGCWLARHGGGGAAGLARLRELWRECPKSATKKSPETQEQEQYVLRWQEGRTITARERYIGCLVGLAVGDAVGTTAEFKSPGSFALVTDMVGGGPFGLKPGQWTDDTSMALCLAESLLTRGGFDAADQMDRYVAWWQRGHLSSTGSCFDIGGTVSGALAKYLSTGEPLAGSADPRSAGNGSLMRLAPAPLYYASDPTRAIAMSAESSRTTHGARTCLDACRYFGGLIVGAVQGVPRDKLLSPRYAPVAGVWEAAPLCPEIDAIACGSYKEKNPPAIRGTGYVVDALEAALWAFDRSADFREGCLLAVNLGDDADTTAAIYGQLAGAYYGVAGIPRAWRDRLAFGDLIIGFAEQLAGRAGMTD